MQLALLDSSPNSLDIFDILLIRSLDLLLVGFGCSPVSSAHHMSWWNPPLTSSDALASEGVRGGFQRMVGMISGWWEWPVGNQQEEKPVKGWGRASRGSRRRGREKKTFYLHRICIMIALAGHGLCIALALPRMDAACSRASSACRFLPRNILGNVPWGPAREISCGIS